MKSRRILRVLCLFGFLLLFAPFYNQCTFGRDAAKTEEPMAVEAPVIEDSVDVALDSVSTNNKDVISDSDSTDSIDVKSDSIRTQEIQNKPIKEELPFILKAYRFVDNGDLDSIFEMSFATVSSFFEKPLNQDSIEHKKKSPKERFEDIVFWTWSFLFVLISLFTTFIFILSFFNKTRSIGKLTITNLVLIALILSYILFLDSFFKGYDQIKWGFYIFTMVQVGILFFSKKNLVKIQSK